MLFGYPPPPPETNWLHTCAINIISQLHQHAEAGTEPPEWPDIIPIQHRAALGARHGFKSKATAYFNKLKQLPSNTRSAILQQITTQNEIANLLDNSLVVTESAFILEIANEIDSLFNYLYNLLDELEIRKLHYTRIYSQIENKICPFCGCEGFDTPSSPSEDFDHYLPTSKYKSASANLQNLIPAGKKCNQQYKRDANIIVNNQNQPRKAFNPFAIQKTTFCLNQSIPFAPAITPQYIISTQIIPTLWQVEFVPVKIECETWNDVYKIKDRLIRDTLEPHFKKWLDVFIRKQRRRPARLHNRNQLELELNEYIEELKEEGLPIRDFIKPAVFTMILHNIKNGNARLEEFIIDGIQLQ